MRCFRFPFTRFVAAAALVAAALTALPTQAQPTTQAQSLRSAVMHPRPIFEPGTTPPPAFTTDNQEWRLVRSMLSPGDLRKLDLEFVRFNLQAQFLSDPEHDPFYDRTRETVRGSYLKVYKEILRRQYPLDELIEDAWANRASARIGDRAVGDDDGGKSPWRVRVSPRVAIGSSGYLGTRLSLPNAGNRWLERMALNMRHGVFEDEWAVGVRYSERGRFLQLERVDGDPKSGDRYTMTVALRF
jgi:hypothetical protein